MHRGCWKVDDNDEVRQAKSDRHHNFSKTLYTKLYSSRNTGSRAVYIDIEENKEEDNGDREYSKWSDLPDLLLENIFSYLEIREKYYASLVCRNWYRAFHLPLVWSNFTLADNTLTRSRFNYYSGWQYVLDHVRCQYCLSSVGKHFKRLYIDPMLNFYNLYEFMNMISWYTEQREEKENVELGVGSNIKLLKFTFLCNMTSREDTERIRLFGTGGKLLAALKRLMGNLKKLERLELIDLMLDPNEAQFLLDEVVETCCLKLKSLHIINTTRVQYQILHVGVFLNLQELYISPQNLGDDMVELLGFTKLKHLHIIQNRYTPTDVIIKPVSPAVWKKCRKDNRGLSVHLQVKSNKERTLIWQENAPVRTVLYNSPLIGLRTDSLATAIEFYRRDLRTYGHLSVPRFHRSKSFTERIDESLMMLVRECEYLSTLVVTERISTTTALLLAYYGRNLKWLFIRGNAVIKRTDWKQAVDWSDEFYSWLKVNSRSYELVEKEISQILGYKWKFMADREFQYLNVNLHDF